MEIIKVKKSKKTPYIVNLSLSQQEFSKLLGNKVEAKDNDLIDFLSKLKFYGKAVNAPREILELKFKKLDFRKDENCFFIDFTVLNSWGDGIMYNIFDYGKSFSLSKEDLI